MTSTERAQAAIIIAVVVLAVVAVWQLGAAQRPAPAPVPNPTEQAMFATSTSIAATDDAGATRPPATPITPYTDPTREPFELPREWRKSRWDEHPQPIQRAADAPASPYTWTGSGKIFQLAGPDWALRDEGRNGDLVGLLDEGRILDGHSDQMAVVEGMVGDGFIFVCIG